MTASAHSSHSYEQPSSTRVCLFQISESNDIIRVTYLLEYLCQKPKETLGQIKKKYHLHKTLVVVIKKYCNGDYGFDQRSAREGVFQLALLKLMTLISQEFLVYLFFLQNKVEQQLGQMIEEAIIFVYEDSLQGNLKRHQPLVQFLIMSLDFIELAISKHF